MITKNFSAVVTTDDCIHSALEECSNDVEVYEDEHYKFFAEALQAAEKTCSQAGYEITISSIRRSISKGRIN